MVNLLRMRIRLLLLEPTGIQCVCVCVCLNWLFVAILSQDPEQTTSIRRSEGDLLLFLLLRALLEDSTRIEIEVRGA